MGVPATPNWFADIDGRGATRGTLLSSNRDLVRFAPTMPQGFYGSVVYEYQGGKLILAKVSETLKPEGV